MSLDESEIQTIRELENALAGLGMEVVLIGATAYRVWVRDPYRTTRDVDAAVAADLENLPPIAEALINQGWRPDGHQEQRWHTGPGRIVDIIPAGENLRAQGRVVWPRSRMTMSLTGFRHVFEQAAEQEIAPGLKVHVVRLPVLVLLKIVAFIDRPIERIKDIDHIASLLDRYESDGPRRFNKVVIDAGVDYESAGALLLGMDVGRLCNVDEAGFVGTFIAQASDTNHRTFELMVRFAPLVSDYRRRDLSLSQVHAFAAGFAMVLVEP